MKKVVLISMLVAGGLFAASLENSTNDELDKMVANADAKALSVADRQNFMQDFRKSYNDKVGALSVAEAKRLDIELKDGDDDDVFHKKFKRDFKGGFIKDKDGKGPHMPQNKE